MSANPLSVLLTTPTASTLLPSLYFTRIAGAGLGVPFSTQYLAPVFSSMPVIVGGALSDGCWHDTQSKSAIRKNDRYFIIKKTPFPLTNPLQTDF